MFYRFKDGRLDSLYTRDKKVKNYVINTSMTDLYLRKNK